MVLDVLTFYQERFANEAFMKTASERRSALELARTIGYELNPGVAASTYLSFTCEDNPESPDSTIVPVGTKVQSIPGDGELPQTFETVEEILARPEWNCLKPYRPVTLIPENTEAGVTSIRIKGTDTDLEIGDEILFVGDERISDPGSERWDIRKTEEIKIFPDKDCTELIWDRGLGHLTPPVNPADKPRIITFMEKASVFGHDAPEWEELSHEDRITVVGEDYGKITDVALTPDGRYAVAGYADSSLIVWEMDSGEIFNRLSGHNCKINCLAISPKGEYVASGDINGVLVLNNIVLKTTKPYVLENGNNSITSIDFSYSENKHNLIVGSNSGKISIWQSDTGKAWELRSAINAHEGAVSSLAFSNAGQFFASGGMQDKSVKIWNFSNSNNPILKAETNKHTLAVTSIDYRISGNTHKVISACLDKTIRVCESSDNWSNSLPWKFSEFKGHALGVNDVKFLPEEGHFISSGADKNVIVWNRYILSGQEQLSTTVLTGHTGAVNSVSISSDGLLAISGSNDKTLKVWDIKNGVEIHTLSTLEDIPKPADWPNCRLSVSMGNYLYLDSAYPQIGKGDWIVLSNYYYKELYRVSSCSVVKHAKYTLSGKVTRVRLDTDENLSKFYIQDTVVLINNRELPLYEEEVHDGRPVIGNRIELDSFVTGLKSGRRIVLGGKQARVLVSHTGHSLKFLDESGSTLKEIYEETVLSAVKAPVIDHSGNETWFIKDSSDLTGTISIAATETLRLSFIHDNPNDANYHQEPKYDVYPANVIVFNTETLLTTANGIWKNRIKNGDTLSVLSPPFIDSDNTTVWHLTDRHGLEGFVKTKAGGSFTLMNIPTFENDDIATEVAALKSVNNDGARTVLYLQDNIKRYYDPATLTISANIALATHGETVEEILGSGNGAVPNQKFKIKSPPLTYVPAKTATGGKGTMNIYVNGVLWNEVDTLFSQDFNKQGYLIQINGDDTTTVTFGDGISGSRLPSGEENIFAIYRKGIGIDGEVNSNTLTMLQAKPLGIDSVINPVPATGASAPETLNDARANAPKSVLTLGRIVSLKDFENFACSFSGIGKAQAVSLWISNSRAIHLTVSGPNGKEVSIHSNQYLNLMNGINAVREPIQRVIVDSYKSLYFNIDVNIICNPNYIADDVKNNVYDKLHSEFMFDKRSLGQTVSASEIITIIQDVPGVTAVDIDSLYMEGNECSFNSVLPAQSARVINNMILPSELLFPNEGGIKIKVKTNE
ncbi:MAG: putative baseplate assembly protein [Nitrospinota bacterium]|nr:putative baseplate assembly protein [Nitrospinota bacterium]